MSKRVLVAGIVAGLAMFVWQSIAHLALPLGKMGVSEIPSEQTLLGTMQATLGGAPGMYLYPAMGTLTPADYQKKLGSNPSGLLIYHPAGSKGMSPGQLAIEFLTELAEALLAVWLLSRSRLQMFWPRVGFIFGVGVVAGLTTNVSYWNWYGFPGSYTVVYAGMQMIGFLVAGLVAAAVLRREKFLTFAVATPALH